MEALLESQDSQISLNRKAIVFEACGNSPVTTAVEKENHRQQVFASLICSRAIYSEYK